MKNIVLIGSFGSSNIGDEAILESMLIFLRDIAPESSIHILSPNPQDTEHRYKKYYNITTGRGIPFGIRSLLRYGKEFLSQISFFKNTTTHVIFPGGGLWTDHESLYAVLLWSVHVFFFSIILQKPVLLVGQSIGPLRGKIARTITSLALKQCKKILIRDELSHHALRELNIPKEHISPMHDMACYLPPSIVETTLPPTNILHIAISLRPWNNTLVVEEELTIYFQKKHHECPIHLHFIPMQYYGSEDVSHMKSMAHICDTLHIPYTEHYPNNYKDVLHILQSCHYAIGMRLHFLILATLAQVPVFALSYSSKVLGFIQGIPSEHYHLLEHTSSTLHIQLDNFFQANTLQLRDTLKQFSHTYTKEKAKNLAPLRNFLQ